MTSTLKSGDMCMSSATIHNQRWTLIGSRRDTRGPCASAKWHEQVVPANRTVILASRTVPEHNVRELVERTGVREVHARFVDEAGMRALAQAL